MPGVSELRVCARASLARRLHHAPDSSGWSVSLVSRRVAWRSDKSGSGFGVFDTSRAGDVEYVVRCPPGEGIAGAIERARRVPQHVPRTFAAVARAGSIDCALEATHAPRGEEQVLDALTVRVRLPIRERANGLAIAREALQSFGGNGYVSLGAARGAPRNAFEATVCFPDLVPWVAQNTLIAPKLCAIDDVTRFGELMRLLGIAHVVRGRQLEIADYQLRLRPNQRTLMAAFESAVESGFCAVLYTAALPVTRSVRIEQLMRPDGGVLDVAITRGLSRKACARADVGAMDAFVKAWLGFGAGSISWRVRAAGVTLPRREAASTASPTGSAPRWKRPELRLIEGGRSARA
jgi:hypothetical protein